MRGMRGLTRCVMSSAPTPSVELDWRGLEPWRRQREKEMKKEETREGTRTSHMHLSLRHAMVPAYAYCSGDRMRRMNPSDLARGVLRSKSTLEASGPREGRWTGRGRGEGRGHGPASESEVGYGAVPCPVGPPKSGLPVDGPPPKDPRPTSSDICSDRSRGHLALQTSAFRGS